MTTPAQHAAPPDVAELLASCVTREEMLHAGIEGLRAQRDAAEARFVKAREEYSDLEQEMADLRLELAGTKERATKYLDTAEEAVEAATRHRWHFNWMGVSILVLFVLLAATCTLRR